MPIHFEPHREFYRENESLDLEALKKEEHDVAFFNGALERYHSQHKKAEAIKVKRPIGMLLVDGVKMKNLLIPSPLRCLDVINDMLPILARKEVDRLIAELQDGQFQLEFRPTTTIEFVQTLTFLDEIQVRVDPLEKEAMIVKDLYDDRRVQCPHSTRGLRSVPDSRSQHHEYKFCTHLDKDIGELTKEVKEVKQDAQNPLILDPSADKDKVRNILKKLLNQMDDLQKHAFTYKSYQKNFKVEVTKFDALEEAHAELKLKELLWNAIDEWDALLDNWTSTPFTAPGAGPDEHHHDEVGQSVMSWRRSPTQRCRPAPQERRSHERKEACITDLRNPTLKTRHWDVIEEILDYHFGDEEMTLGKS
ncbi:hypothetical protein ScPMuIL_003325 [Solemya velum]